MPDATATIKLCDNAIATAVLGRNHGHLRAIQKAFPAQVVARGDTVTITGEDEDVERVRLLFEKLLDLAEENHAPTDDEVSYLISRIAQDKSVDGVLSDVVRVTHWGEAIRPKTAGQHRYTEAIRDNDIVFSIGPAGTGKTYLAVASAIEYLKTGRVKRIILTRPAVEAGEELGFLPGDIQAKVSPYLRPLYDAIFDMMPAGEFERLLGQGRIEVAPLAFMRGRTLNSSFVILDEAQNTTSIQMKMFLTRLGFHSKAIITGDVTQVDLQIGRSGLIAVQNVLTGIEGITFVRLTKSDVVRHPLVARIIEAYDRHAEPPAAMPPAAAEAGPESAADGARP
jgi:phosphate starvation-inducible PhoH-like protein